MHAWNNFLRTNRHVTPLFWGFESWQTHFWPWNYKYTWLEACSCIHASCIIKHACMNWILERSFIFIRRSEELRPSIWCMILDKLKRCSAARPVKGTRKIPASLHFSTTSKVKYLSNHSLNGWHLVPKLQISFCKTGLFISKRSLGVLQIYGIKGIRSKRAN